MGAWGPAEPCVYSGCQLLKLMIYNRDVQTEGFMLACGFKSSVVSYNYCFIRFNRLSSTYTPYHRVDFYNSYGIHPV
jgi:hypothetical protein